MAITQTKQVHSVTIIMYPGEERKPILEVRYDIITDNEGEITRASDHKFILHTDPDTGFATDISGHSELIQNLCTAAWA